MMTKTVYIPLIVLGFSMLSLSPTLAELTRSPAKLWRTERGGNDHRYQVVHFCGNGRRRPSCRSEEDRVSWEEARNAALAFGGDLASITSAEENEFIEQLIMDSPFVAEGPDGTLRFNLGTGWWIGGIRTLETIDPAVGWSWVTGEPFDFTDWAPGEPNDYSGRGGFPEIYTHILDPRFLPGDELAWNDEAAMFGLPVSSFVVEFPTIPEPTTASFVIVAIGISISRRVPLLGRPENGTLHR